MAIDKFSAVAFENKSGTWKLRYYRDSLKAGVIKEDNLENKSKKYASYLPY